MKKLPIVVLLIVSGFLSAQEIFTPVRGKLIKDLDEDGRADTVYMENKRIVCRLSSLPFQKIQSKAMETFTGKSGLFDVKNSLQFVFLEDGDEEECRYRFQYDKKSRQVHLAGMDSWGNRGYTSINLITYDYTGDFYFKHAAYGVLVKIPIIKTKMVLPSTRLEDFSRDTYVYFNNKSTHLYNAYKRKIIKEYEDSGKPFPFIYSPEKRIESYDTLRLDFIPIAETEFLGLKARASSFIYGGAGESECDSSYILQTQKVCYEFQQTDFTRFYYIGYILNKYHAIRSCGRETCEVFFLDDETNRVLSLPSPFDGGVSGISVSESGNRMLYYSSYPVCEDYYSCRTEIMICEVEEGEVISSRVFVTSGWSVEEVCWINDSFIALKTYDESNPDMAFEVSRREYSYLKAEIKNE